MNIRRFLTLYGPYASLGVGIGLTAVWAVTIWCAVILITDDRVGLALFFQVFYAAVLTVWVVIKALYFRRFDERAH